MTYNLVLSVFHADGETRAHRARFSTKEIRDAAAASVVAEAGASKNVVVGPDADGTSLVVVADKLKALHVRVENPPESVDVAGVQYKDVGGVLYPNKWFKPEQRFAIN